MEIQFSIRLVGSSRNKAFLETTGNKESSANQPIESHSLESHAPASPAKPASESKKETESSFGRAGQGDGTGPGGNGSGMGSVIVIGPIVITGAASSGDIEGGQGDGTSTGGQGDGTGTGGSRSQH